MTEHERMTKALNKGKEDDALEILERHPGLAERRFLNRHRQRGHSAPLLLHAAELGMSRLVKKLLQLGIGVDTWGGNGGTSLHFAASGGHPKTVQVLLDAGATIDPRCSMWGNTPLGWTGGNESKDLVTCARMLVDAGASPDIQSTRGYTPHARARLYGPDELIAYFAQIGAPLELPATEGAAVETGNPPCPEGRVLHIVVRDGQPADLCGHDVELEGTVTPTRGRADGEALHFENGCLRVAHDDRFNAAGGITVAAWLRIEGDADDENAIISKGRWERQACPWELAVYPDWDLTFHCYGELAHERCTFQSFRRREWHHVAAVWDGERQHLYIDGIGVTSSWAGEQPADNRVPVTVGRRADDPDCYRNPLRGSLEDIVVFDRAIAADMMPTVMGLTAGE